MPNSSSSSHQDGIDIKVALDILTARSSSGNNESSSTNNNETSITSKTAAAACPCCTSNAGNIPNEAKSMGQQIDMMMSAGDTGTDAAAKSAKNVITDSSDNNDHTKITEQERKQILENRREEVNAKIQGELKSMNVKELLQAVLKAQQDRVAVYKQFDNGLDEVLKTGNITHYPVVCAEATASFSVLSDTINMIHSTLSKNKRNDLTKLLKNLQKSEQEKLNLTAALHLEMLRERNQSIATTSGDDGGNNGSDRIAKLLSQNVQSLKGKIAGCIEQINEALEEVRFAMMEEDDDETEDS